MEEFEQRLRNMVLAPYIVKATALIGIPRKTSGNMFRHAMATFAILVDYKYDDAILLKASIIHDLLEDCPETSEQELRQIDNDANQVIDLVLEVTKKKSQTTNAYLKTILETGSSSARILKVGDRISNLNDLNRAHYSVGKMNDKLKESEEFVLPMAEMENKNMATELRHLIARRREEVNFMKIPKYFRLRKLLSIFI